MILSDGAALENKGRPSVLIPDCEVLPHFLCWRTYKNVELDSVVLSRSSRKIQKTSFYVNCGIWVRHKSRKAQPIED